MVLKNEVCPVLCLPHSRGDGVFCWTVDPSTSRKNCPSSSGSPMGAGMSAYRTMVQCNCVHIVDLTSLTARTPSPLEDVRDPQPAHGRCVAPRPDLRRCHGCMARTTRLDQSRRITIRDNKAENHSCAGVAQGIGEASNKMYLARHGPNPIQVHNLLVSHFQVTLHRQTVGTNTGPGATCSHRHNGHSFVPMTQTTRQSMCPSPAPADRVKQSIIRQKVLSSLHPTRGDEQSFTPVYNSCVCLSTA